MREWRPVCIASLLSRIFGQKESPPRRGEREEEEEEEELQELVAIDVLFVGER